MRFEWLLRVSSWNELLTQWVMSARKYESLCLPESDTTLFSHAGSNKEVWELLLSEHCFSFLFQFMIFYLGMHGPLHCWMWSNFFFRVLLASVRFFLRTVSLLISSNIQCFPYQFTQLIPFPWCTTVIII